MSGARRVHHAAKTKQIRTRTNAFSLGLFRRHELRGSRNRTTACHRRFIDYAGQTKIGNHRAIDAVIKQNIGGFYIAVNDAPFVSGFQPLGDLHSNANCFSGFEWTVSFDSLVQRTVWHVLHHDIGSALKLLDEMNRHNMWIFHRGNRFSFTFKPSPRAPVVGINRSQHFDCDESIQAWIKCFDDDARTATTDDAANFVASKSTHHFRVVGRSKHVLNFSQIALTITKFRFFCFFSDVANLFVT